MGWDGWGLAVICNLWYFLLSHYSPVNTTESLRQNLIIPYNPAFH
uniref:Uncharacterized protein n=1 Tax=Anguilla anguilla TaxID=7936 RepID=A0A0E9V2E8_ANGAN